MNGHKAWEDKDFVNRHNKAVSASSRRMWLDSEFRERQSKLIRESLNTDRVHKLHHDRLVKQWKNHQYRLMMTQNAANMVIDGKLGKSIITDLNGNTYTFKSTWEVEFATILSTLNIKFNYECKKFRYFLITELEYIFLTFI